MSIEDARLDHLTLKLDSLRQALLLRADALSSPGVLARELRKQIRIHGGASEEALAAALASVLADEFRTIAGSLE